jgi:hypothetical protein
MFGPRDLFRAIPEPLPVHDKSPAVILGFAAIVAILALAFYWMTRSRKRQRSAYVTQPPPRAVATTVRRTGRRSR